MAKLTELTEWRKKQQLTQAQLGAKLSRHQVLISDWEKGARPIANDALQDLRALGYDGPAEAVSPSPLTRSDFEEFMKAHTELLVAELRAAREEIQRIRDELKRGKGS